MKNESVYASGKLFELVHLAQPNGRVFEVARRAPGVRVIIADKTKKKLLLTREVRRELATPDYRLPGGKVFDSLTEFEAFRVSGKDIAGAAAAKAKAEAQEEAGIAVEDVKFVKKSVVGATVEWDLYVFEATQWHPHEEGQSLEEGEQVEDVSWYDFTDVEQMILEGAMQEERIALITLQWLKAQV
jgi:8-oxo-dGTP pyrophosphatase MutT (NUDIX family)